MLSRPREAHPAVNPPAGPRKHGTRLHPLDERGRSPRGRRSAQIPKRRPG